MRHLLLIAAFLALNVYGQSSIAVKCQKVGDLAETSMLFAVAGMGVDQAILRSFQLYPGYRRELITYEVPVAFYTLKEMQRGVPNPPRYSETGQLWYDYLVTEFRQSRQLACIQSLS